VTIRLHDTATRSVRDFVPLHEGKVSVYLCGATVQAPPHLGHVRSGVNFDILSRWLTYRGYEVTFCRNVTDIDDKIIHRAAEEGVPFWRVAQRNERAFDEAYRQLGCLPPTVAPRATGHVPEMIQLMRALIERGHAYPGEDGVFYDVSSYADYGALSGRRVDMMQTGGDVEGGRGKHDPRDFALWKAAKPGEPSWETPWGEGRPGWHLECSAMAWRYLGERFDIHGGGVELTFPHHENEIAQSRGVGFGFANYWLHNAWLTVGGEKMSKSMGNSMLVSELVTRHRPVVLRYYLVMPHYRSTVEYTDEALDEAAAAYARIEQFVRRAVELVGVVAPTPVPDAFAEAMDDDLGVPAAAAVLHQTVRQGNAALSAEDKEKIAALLGQTRGMLDVLGLDPLSSQWSRESGAATDGRDLSAVIDKLVAVALESRQAARERRDYAAADGIRDRLAEAGVAIEDTPHGPRWTLA
jgi:cysteinyl-tRNA synthetase